MPRTRNPENRGLPLRWRHVNGAYYYSVPPGQEPQWDGKKLFRLGTKPHEAYQVWSSMRGIKASVRSIGDLLDRYAMEIVPERAAATQVSSLNQMMKLRQGFGTTPLSALSLSQVYQYLDARSKKRRDEKTDRVVGGRIAAHREIELLSQALTKAVYWGYIDQHPFKKELRLKGEAPRTRYVADWEVKEAMSLKPRRGVGSVLMIQAYLRVKLLTGMAQGDLLRLRLDVNFKDDGIHNQRHKTKAVTGKKLIYPWSDELREAFQTALDARPNKSDFLFCDREGHGYINEEVGRAHGWKSIWQRFMKRLLMETKVTEHFTEHDLRAKVGSDASTLEEASSLLGHADLAITRRVYRRKPETLEPPERETTVDNEALGESTWTELGWVESTHRAGCTGPAPLLGYQRQEGNHGSISS